ncbi:MAG: glucosamine-6-phosphate deaminase [Chryseolinea sp.]
MTIQIFKDYSALSRATADLIVEYLRSKPISLVCLASGHSPKGVFDCLVDEVKSNRLNLDQCSFVSLDEWIGIPATQKGSCRAMMDDDFFNPAQIDKTRIFFFDGMAQDPSVEVLRINNLIDDHGGLDIMLVGVGTNGHIAMNEPGTPFDIKAHVSTLAEETKSVGQKYFSSSTELDQGITLGLRHFREAKLPILVANGEKKAAIMKKILSSTTASENLPASIVHVSENAMVLVDEAAYGGKSE